MEKMIRILHVDDSLHDRQLVADTLRNAADQFDLVEADNRTTFEDRLKEVEFDLVLSDFNIFGFDGLQVLEIVRIVKPDLPVVIVTGTGSEEIAIEAMKRGAADYVIKSVHHIQGLPTVIRKVLDNKRIQREHRDAIIALHESEALFRAAFESAAIGVVLVGLDGCMLKVNDAFCRMIGYSRSELEMHHFNEVSHPDDRDKSLDYLKGVIQEEPVAAILEKRYIRKDKEVVWAIISTGLVKKAIQGQDYIVTYVQNISQRKRYEAELLEINETLEQRVRQRTLDLQLAVRELESFSYSVSHDLRAPMRAIEGFSHILAEDYTIALDEEGKRLIGLISRNVTQMNRLIDSLLSLAIIGREELKIVPIDMGQMVSSVLDELVLPADRPRIEINLSDLPSAQGDQVLIRQVWVNLLSNALKYSSRQDRSEIGIGTLQSDGQLTYFVRDNGIGFDLEKADKLFSPFQRFHSIREYEGTGIGLATVDRIIRRHGGRIWATSEPGQGATFYFVLP